MTIRTLSLHFDLPLFPRQIPHWRGAFAELAGVENDLFHNHKNDLQSQMPDTIPTPVGKIPEALQPETMEGFFVQQATNQHLTSVGDTEDISLYPPIFPTCSVSTESSYHPITPSTHPPQYHYRYPTIHYRAYQGKASIFALNDGIEAAQSVLSNNAWRINWQGEPRPLLITGMQMQEYELRMLSRPKTYHLYKWLALNADNHEKWQRCQHLTERIALLEHILTSHILAFARGVDWNIPDRLNVRLQHIQQTQTVKYHGNDLLAFNVAYTANVLLPPHIALGKAVSHGFGWQVPRRGRMGG